eukprot:51458-Chlamydomonas_euryale.AAC.8
MHVLLSDGLALTGARFAWPRGCLVCSAGGLPVASRSGAARGFGKVVEAGPLLTQPLARIPPSPFSPTARASRTAFSGRQGCAPFAVIARG